MIGTIAIYRGTGCLAAGEHPYFAQGANVNPTPVKSYSGKFTEDLDQVIQVPVFDGWSSCNLCRLSSGTWKRWYWITDISRVSDTGSSIQLALTYCPILDISERSSYETAQTLRGSWTRIPSPRYSQICHFEPSAGAERPQQFEWYATHIADLASYDHYVGEPCWVQVTFSKGSGTSAGIGQYGFFADIAYPSKGATLGGGDGMAVWYTYPDFIRVITDPYTTLGITASTIVDISVSPICPYYCTGPGGALPVINCTDASGNVLGPDKDVGNWKDGSTTRRSYVYDLSSGSNNLPAKTFADRLSLVDVRLWCGSHQVIDPWGRPVGTFSMATPQGGSAQVHTVSSRCIADTTGMMLQIMMDNTEVLQYQMPHVPYVGTQWDEYRATNMAYDRQATEFSISTSREALQIQKDTAAMNTAVSVGSSLLSGNIMGAVTSTLGTLIGMNAQDRSQTLSEKSARFAQSLTEQRVQAMSPVAYSTGYGFADVQQMHRARYRIAWCAAAGTSDMFSTYVSTFGYPVKIPDATISVDAVGFYQGRLTSVSAPVHGAMLDRLNEVMTAGVKKVLYQDVTE